MAYTNIDKPSKYFNTKLYTGDGGTQSVTGVGFAPDWSWLKCRSSAYNHRLYDTVRGALKNLQSNSTSAEITATNGLSAFNSDGFTVVQGGDEYNQSGQTYASWNWKANGAGVSNTAGTISSTVSANTTSGFSIVSYTGNGTSGATVGHGLGTTPALVIAKGRQVTNNWLVWHKNLTAQDYYLHLETTGAQAQNSAFFSAFSSTTFTLGNSAHINSSGLTNIAYCFAEVKGYSKFGSYTGNGSTDGTFVYTGFKPAMIIAKQADGGQSWQIHDTARDTFNLATRVLFPNSSSAEQNSSANGALDILSNGFKWRMADADQNGSGSTYIYMAFASNPFVSSTGIPTTAR